MSRAIGFRRQEFTAAALDLGTVSIDLQDYATTGLRVVAVGPSGIGKTNGGLLIAEQLAAQGWYAVLMDPEGEISELYPTVLTTPDALERHLAERTGEPIAVVPVRDAAAFLPFGQVVMAAADELRRPIFLMLDEGQIFSTSRRKGREDVLGQASDLVNEFIQRGRKRALDLFLSAHRFSASLNRAVFGSKNLTLVGRQEDPSSWFALAPMFKGSGIDYADVAALSPGEFFCFSRRGVEKVVMPMAAALAQVAPKATTVRPQRPSTFSQWDRAIREIPTERLKRLTPPAVALLGTITGLSTQQLATGARALHDELAARG
jgi:hypothetical protein